MAVPQGFLHFGSPNPEQPVSQAEDRSSSLLDGRSVARIYPEQSSSCADNIINPDLQPSVQICAEEGLRTETFTEL